MEKVQRDDIAEGETKLWSEKKEWLESKPDAFSALILGLVAAGIKFVFQSTRWTRLQPTRVGGTWSQGTLGSIQPMPAIETNHEESRCCCYKYQVAASSLEKQEP